MPKTSGDGDMGQKERISKPLEPTEEKQASEVADDALRVTRARVISLSTRYLTLELHEPTNLQQGQLVFVSLASVSFD